MSRCYSCDHILTPQELTRKFKKSLTFTELCNSCLSTMDVDTVDSEYDFNEYISDEMPEQPEKDDDDNL